MKRKTFLKISIEILIVIFVIAVFVFVNDNITSDKFSSFLYIEDSNQYAYLVEDLIGEEKDIVIKGWFFKPQKVRNVTNESTEDLNLGIVLLDIESSKNQETYIDGTDKPLKGIRVKKIDRSIRNDINDYFDCEYNYSDCGFEARIDKNELNFESGIYQIVFKPIADGDYGINTNTFIDHGKLVYYNPKEKMDLNINDTDLKDIVNYGACVLSYSSYGICVYQYNKKLYWIVDESFDFEEDGGTYIQYHLDTTQFEKLPKDRTENGWYWSNIGFDFENYEISNSINCGKYRVSVRDIPMDFAVTKISSGYYLDNKLIWGRCFSPISLYK